MIPSPRFAAHALYLGYGLLVPMGGVMRGAGQSFRFFSLRDVPLPADALAAFPDATFLPYATAEPHSTAFLQGTIFPSRYRLTLRDEVLFVASLCAEKPFRTIPCPRLSDAFALFDERAISPTTPITPTITPTTTAAEKILWYHTPAMADAAQSSLIGSLTLLPLAAR